MMTDDQDSFKLVGLKLHGKTTNQNNQSSMDCGSLWQKFEADHIFNQIPRKLSDEIYAVYFEYEKDETSPFSYFIGCKVDTNDITPEGLSELIIPAQKYKRHTAKGTMPACIADAWKEIWNSDLNRSFEYDFEVYGERSRDWSNAEVDIFISATY